MDITGFIGRLHPLLVHLPIGFLTLALLVEWFMGKNQGKSQVKVIMFVLVLGALSSIVAALCGWFLANSGGYENNTLAWHRWLGTSICLLAIVAPFAKHYKQKKSYRFILVAIGALLFAVGHFGGSLTHGSDYLLQPLRGDKGDGYSNVPEAKNPDSLIVFQHLIRPILEQKCYDCHNTEKDMGGLNMMTYEKLIAGGEHGVVIEKDPWSSELIKRVTLPSKSKYFMPPKGAPLDYNEISILKWWIEQGFDSIKSVMQMKPDKNIAHILATVYKVDTSPKTFFERTKVDPMDESVLDSLTGMGWQIKRIAQDNHFVEVSHRFDTPLSKGSLSVLGKIKDNITWLDLSGIKLTDSDMDGISKFKNVTKLHLNDNAITGQGLRALSELKNLESLNLNNNPLSVEDQDWIKPLTSLKRIYLWKTDIKPEYIEQIHKTSPELQIIL
ncbi:c-type cytochrome domain-containing protein [Flagellimonas aequoris]|uniref:Uncharacterized protein n=1 Tax=Flagellimonas aequoris TaxID=2306997 RepID=A0A418N863_9FLAO|nr:c-type cytochrome domain-containing protein [Allomuricauda aequoris]RIV71543.1 hypothetical protein D2U88_07195 [Allomuricauda aequoris]TXK03108.1 hypothetical protein FQ019_07140 [Allomuricauda aequoris]